MNKQVKCKLCGSDFTLTEKQLKFYTDREWSNPKVCAFCRETKRQEKKNPYYGLEEAIANHTPIKKRRQRVYYNSYVVGGLR